MLRMAVSFLARVVVAGWGFQAQPVLRMAVSFLARVVVAGYGGSAPVSAAYWGVPTEERAAAADGSWCRRATRIMSETPQLTPVDRMIWYR